MSDISELRGQILNDILVHDEDCASSLYDLECNCINQKVANNIMLKVDQYTAKQAAAAIPEPPEDLIQLLSPLIENNITAGQIRAKAAEVQALVAAADTAGRIDEHWRIRELKPLSTVNELLNLWRDRMEERREYLTAKQSKEG